MNKIVSILAIVLILVLVGFSTNLNTENNDEIKIGVVLGLSGPAATQSEIGKKGIDLAVKEINNSGGINGKPITVIYEDNQTDSSKSVSAFNKLVTLDKVDVVIGSTWDFITNPLVPLSEDLEITVIASQVISEAIEGESPYFFDMGPVLENSKDAVRKFFDVNPEIEKVALLCFNNSWGDAHKKIYRDVASEKGIEIVIEECTYFGTDYRTEVIKIINANPDAILASGLPEIYSLRMNELGVSVPVITTNSIVDAIELQSVPAEIAEGIYFFDQAPNAEFSEKFMSEYGMKPILEAHLYYDSVYAIKNALENNPNNLQQGLKNLSYEGTGGLLDFTVENQNAVNQAKAKLYQIVDGEYLLVE